MVYKEVLVYAGTVDIYFQQYLKVGNKFIKIENEHDPNEKKLVKSFTLKSNSLLQKICKLTIDETTRENLKMKLTTLNWQDLKKIVESYETENAYENERCAVRAAEFIRF